MTHSLPIAAHALVAGGRGILAVDGPSAAHLRAPYRALVAGAPGIERYVGGMLFESEALAQRCGARTLLELVRERGIAAGIGLDIERSRLAFSPGEARAAELDGLGETLETGLAACAGAGVQFAGCRAAFGARDDDAAVARSAKALALTATACQRAGLVAFVEPQICAEDDRDIGHAAEAARRVLRAVVAALGDAGAAFEGLVIQTGMVAPGRCALREATTADVVAATLRVLGETIPVAVAGIAFLSNGPDERIATERLCAINRTMPRRRPWPLTFSYGRSLQQAVFATWRGRAENAGDAQRVLVRRAYCSGLAACGAYTEKVEAQLRTSSVPIAA